MKKKILIISNKVSCVFYSSVLSKTTFSVDTVKVDDLQLNEDYFTNLDIQKIMNINEYDAVITDKKNYVLNFLLLAYCGLLVLVNNGDKDIQSDTNQILSNIGHWAFENIKKRGRNFIYIMLSNKKITRESPILNRKSEMTNFENKNNTKTRYCLDSLLVNAINNRTKNYKILKKIALVITNKNIKQKIKFISSFVNYLSKLFDYNNPINKIELVILSDSNSTQAFFGTQSALNIDILYRLYSLKRLSETEIKNTLKILEYDDWLLHNTQYIFDDNISHISDCDYVYIDSDISKQIFSLIPYSIINLGSHTNILKLKDICTGKRIEGVIALHIVNLFHRELLTGKDINYL